jgi:membrane protease YdiL (CAAX protease family)
MDEPSADIVRLFLNYAILAVYCGGIAVWLMVLYRVVRRRPIVKFEARRPVPWNGWDAVVVFVAFYLIAVFLALAAETVLGWDLRLSPQAASTAEPANEDSDLDRAHPIVVLLSSDLNRSTVLLCLLSAVIMAPIAEEFVFRLVLQGYFENVDFHARRLFRYSARWLGLGPVVVSSFIFAGLHFRVPGPRAPEQIMHLLMIDAAARVLLVLGGIAYLKWARLATWTDLGIRFDTFLTDLRLAAIAFAAVCVPIYAVQNELARRFPDVVPDPLPLFLLALALGYLYFRTHRIMPALLLHLIFNATSLGMFFATTPSS